MCLIILGALAYLGRRGWARARSFRAGGKGQAAASSCATGCGSCGDERTAATNAKPQNALVQITNAGSAPTRQRTS
ncbi:MAG TPA: hypothetical protein VK388_18710 [Pyrinomonadaceae bacterium]|nr:hypothetical protein [Pyrinomonadaceae bacterium]